MICSTYLNQYNSQKTSHSTEEKIQKLAAIQQLIWRITRILAIASWPACKNWAISLRICFSCTSLLFCSSFMREIDRFRHVLLPKAKMKKNEKTACLLALLHIESIRRTICKTLTQIQFQSIHQHPQYSQSHLKRFANHPTWGSQLFHKNSSLPTTQVPISQNPAFDWIYVKYTYTFHKSKQKLKTQNWDWILTQQAIRLLFEQARDKKNDGR